MMAKLSANSDRLLEAAFPILTEFFQAPIRRRGGLVGLQCWFDPQQRIVSLTLDQVYLNGIS